jgi:glycerol-3-phosphate O-acyltransferase
MSEVAVPLWLAVAAGSLAAWAFYEHILMPALRWLVMHPANQVIDEVGKRLHIGIRPFQRTRRQALIHRLLTDPKVQQAARHALQHKVSLKKRSSGWNATRDTVPAFNAYLLRIGYWIGKRVARCSTACAWARRLGEPGAGGVGRDGGGRLNHRSNMDYVLAGYLAADQTALSYAVGEWAHLAVST